MDDDSPLLISASTCLMQELITTRQHPVTHFESPAGRKCFGATFFSNGIHRKQFGRWSWGQKVGKSCFGLWLVITVIRPNVTTSYSMRSLSSLRMLLKICSQHILSFVILVIRTITCVHIICNDISCWLFRNATVCVNSRTKPVCVLKDRLRGRARLRCCGGRDETQSNPVYDTTIDLWERTWG